MAISRASITSRCNTYRRKSLAPVRLGCCTRTGPLRVWTGVVGLIPSWQRPIAFDLLDGVMPEIAWLDDSQTLTYLHATVSTRRYRVGVPDVPFHIDALLADAALVGGLAPMLGDQHLRVVSVRGFPTSTWPGILDDLNRLGFAYRWSTRFLCLDKAEAERELGACGANGSPSARTSSRCCAKRSFSRKARWSIPMPATRPPTPMPPCRSWAAIKSPSATSPPR